MKRALHGVRVLEIGDELTQYTGKMLADMGADVVKVEPHTGASARSVGPFQHDHVDMNNSLYFWHYNTSKKSVTIDLTNENERNMFYKIVSNFDVVIGEGTAEFLKEHKLDYSSLCQYNSGVIYCSITPFGQDGPWSKFKSSDLIQLALGGIMSVTGYDEIPNAPPIAPTGSQSTHLAGYFAAMGIISALLYRDMTGGEGQFIDVAVHDCVAVSTEMSIPFWEYRQEHVIRQTGRHALPQPSTRWNLKCKDGRYILCLNTYLNRKKWRALVDWLSSQGLEQDLSDARYEDDSYRALHMNHVTDVLEEFAKNNESDHIYRYAQKLGLPWAAIRTSEEMLDDPHLFQDRGAFIPVKHSETGEVFYYAGAPFIMNETPWIISSRPPLLGEHNDLYLSSYVTEASET